MRLPLFIATRYLFSTKSHSVITLISWVSAVAVGVPVAAMIILLSVFNGFEGLVKDMYGDFDPDIAVVPVEGKVFSREALDIPSIAALSQVAAVSEVLEDNALLEYRGRQFIATVRGVDSAYVGVVPIEGMLVEGNFDLRFGDMMQAVVGQGLAYNLMLRPALNDPIGVLVPRKGASFSSLLPVDAFRQDRIFPTGIFALDAETDGKYMIVPVEFTRGLLGEPDGVSSLAVKLAPGVDPARGKEAVGKIAGEGFEVLTRYEQKASLYRIMNYEKWGIFFIIFMVVVIASFSVVGSMVMLVIDKRSDVRTLFNMGADIRLARGIFLREGMLIAAIGAAGGLLQGLSICWLQKTFGIIKIPAETFLVSRYPVDVQWVDVAVICLSIAAVSWLLVRATVAVMIPKTTIRV
ncbi:MAG: ABC transporter permease [Rikenellaceae bacterium]|nr:ABC transporter permease [Rikenellaceae bacterium]